MPPTRRPGGVAAGGAGALRSGPRRRSRGRWRFEIEAPDPLRRTLRAIEDVPRLNEAMILARVDEQLRRDAMVLERAIHHQALFHRTALVLGAHNEERRRLRILG